MHADQDRTPFPRDVLQPADLDPPIPPVHEAERPAAADPDPDSAEDSLLASGATAAVDVSPETSKWGLPRLVTQ